MAETQESSPRASLLRLCLDGSRCTDIGGLRKIIHSLEAYAWYVQSKKIYPLNSDRHKSIAS